VINDADRRELLRIAREALMARIGGATAPERELSGASASPAGAFVTLIIRGELRGCIGHIEPDETLGRVVARCAAAAAISDPRFPAVTAAELAEIEIELSVLGALERVADLDEIEIGRHGLVVELGRHRGLLLPQVATEWRWDRGTFLEQTCHKAGLPRDAWKRGATVWRFEAEVFGENRAGEGR
jgi:AmmeMemoRadiSam system protein A